MTTDEPQLLCPVCPWCGQPPAFLVSTRQAVCASDDCPAFMWNPTEPAAANIAGARQLVEDEDEDGRLTIRPEPAPELCHCGRPAAGLVKPDEVGTPGHVCKQCGPEHCELRRFTLAE